MHALASWDFVSQNPPSANPGVMGDKTNIMEIMPLGAGEEVGRSCCLLKFMGKTILFDCGVHPAYSGMAALPFFDEIETDQIDIVLITHYHLDHAAGLPYLMQRTNFNPKARVFMTQPTRAIYKTLLMDFVRMSRNAAGFEDVLYTEEDVDQTMSRIEVVDYHAEVNVDGVKFRPFYAAHVLGAAMFMVDISGVRILYTGDFSREQDRHLREAEVPPFNADVLIVESTYGLQVHDSQRIREMRFKDHVSRVVRDGGRVLMPVFALGRAQELLLILDEHWEANPDLQHVPIYYASAIAQRCMPVYQTYVNMMNENVRQRAEFSNPFDFKYVRNVRGKDGFDDNGPCVFMASPGMLQNGLSRELFERWCSTKRNMLMLTGYSVDGTMAKTVLNSPETITRLDGREDVKPRHTVLVHGERNNMTRLKGHLDGYFNSATNHPDRSPTKLYSPSNCQIVQISFRDVRVARAIGIAQELRPGLRVSGVLISKDFSYTLIRQQDIPRYTSFKVSSVDQHQLVPLSGKSLVTLATQLKTVFGDVQYSERGCAVLVCASVLVDGAVEEGAVRVSWHGGHAADVLADAVVALVLTDARHVREAEPAAGMRRLLDAERRMLAERFGKMHKVHKHPERSRMVVDLVDVVVDHLNGVVQCKDRRIRERVRMAYRRIHMALFPIPVLYCACCAEC